MFTIKMISGYSQHCLFIVQGEYNFRFAFIYHLSKDTPLRRTDTVPSGLGAASATPPAAVSGPLQAGSAAPPTAPPHTAMDEPDLTRQASDLKIKPNFK